MFDEILNSFTAADEMLGKRIEKLERTRFIEVTFKNVVVTSGTAGTRALQLVTNLSSVLANGETLISISVVSLPGGSSTSAIITPLITGGSSIAVNVYRADGSATTFSEIVVRVLVSASFDKTTVTV